MTWYSWILERLDAIQDREVVVGVDGDVMVGSDVTQHGVGCRSSHDSFLGVRHLMNR